MVYNEPTDLVVQVGVTVGSSGSMDALGKLSWNLLQDTSLVAEFTERIVSMLSYTILTDV